MEVAQKNFLSRLLNLGVGRAGSALSELADTRVNVVVPEVEMCQISEVIEQLSIFKEGNIITVTQSFTGAIKGSAILLLSNYSGMLLTQRLMENMGDLTAIEPAKKEVLTEIGNIVINSFIGSWSESLSEQFRFGVPEYMERPLQEVLAMRERELSIDNSGISAIWANTHFDIREFFIMGTVLLLFGQESIDKLMSHSKAQLK